MSVPVDLDALAEQVAEHGPQAMLVTVGDGPRPHAVAVEVAWEAGRLRAGAGNRTSANVTARPDVSVLWPTLTPGAYSLIVDGRATVEGTEVVVVPSRAVLHRTPVGSSGADPSAPSCITVLRHA